MEAKHTRGPWEIMTFSNHELQTDFAMVKIGDRAHMVGYSDEDKANARLIAAAPEMRDALRSIILQVIQGKVLERDACITQARAAIAKAEGR